MLTLGYSGGWRSGGGSAVVTLTREGDGTITATIAGASTGYLHYKVDGGASVFSGLVSFPYTLPGVGSSNNITEMFGATSVGSIDADFAAIPSDGLIAEWRFDEGSGTAVTDYAGAYDINLTTAPTPNTTWSSTGVDTADGAIQTPSVTGVRTIVMLVETNQADTNGFLVSGPTATNVGPTAGALVAGETYHVGRGFGVASGADAQWNSSGGWMVVFRELAASSTGYMTFGSRGGSTLNRWDYCNMAYALVYNRVLDGSDRADIYSAMRGVAASRSIPLHFADMAGAASDFFVLFGQSNADGRAVLTDMTPSDQARTYTDQKLSKSDSAIADTSFTAMTLGATVIGRASNFGPEVYLANTYQDAGNPLHILKVSRGGTSIGPSSDSNVSLPTYSPTEAVTLEGFHGGVIKAWHYNIANALDSGIKLAPPTMIYFQGETDADYTSTADVYESQLTTFISKFDSYTATEAPIILCRVFENPETNATAMATVRAAQASVVTALGARGTLIDTDAMSRSDFVHLNKAGMESLNTAILAAL